MKLRKLTQIVGLTFLLAASAGISRAALIVDTGGTLGGTPWTLGRIPAHPDQSLAAKFTLSADTTITAVQGFISVDIAGNGVEISIAADGGLVPGASLFSATASPTGGPTFQGVSGLSWDLPAGDYWVTYVGQGTFLGNMPGNAPAPLAVEAAGTSQPVIWHNSNGLDIGVRIYGDTRSLVPDGGSSVALLGLALVALVGFRRRLG